MTNLDFIAAVNKLLKKKGSIRTAIKVGRSGVNTSLLFDGLDLRTVEILNNFFHSGISLDEINKRTVYINTQFEKKIQI